MKYGTSYYPELTLEAEWGRDLDLMRSAGLTVVRILDFAWSAIEPREGVYDFAWLNRFLDLCRDAGLDVVLCTPTAAPPQWLMAQYPQMMVERRNGDRLAYGERRACCVNNTVYRTYSAGLARRIGERYGAHPAVIGWQIDNELIGPEFREFFECHCPDCAWRFRQWLKARYPTVQALNDAWGLRFWSMEFTAWGEVPTPRCHRACLGHTLDFHRFYSDSQVEYLKVQYDALRATVDARQFVSHNSTGIFDRGIDHRAYARALDVAGWDAYRGAAAAGHGPHAPATALAHDLFRCSLRKPFWVFETGPDGAMPTSFFAEAMARGAEGVLFWLWRTHRANLEQGSTAFCDFDGVPYEGRIETLRAIQARVAELEQSAGAGGLSCTERAPAAFLFDPDNVRAEHRSPKRPMPYLDGVFRLYAPLWGHGIATDVACPGDLLVPVADPGPGSRDAGGSAEVGPPSATCVGGGVADPGPGSCQAGGSAEVGPPSATCVGGGVADPGPGSCQADGNAEVGPPSATCVGGGVADPGPGSCQAGGNAEVGPPSATCVGGGVADPGPGSCQANGNAEVGLPSATRLDGYRLAVMPGLRLMSTAQAEAIRAFVAGGGVLLATARTAHMDLHGVYYRNLGEPLLDVLGVRIRPEPANLARSEVVTGDGQAFRCDGPHGEWVEPGDDVEVLARFRSGPLDGQPAAFTRVFGKGRVFYAAAQACDGLNAWLARQAAEAAGLTWHANSNADLGLLPSPDGRGLWAFNHGETDCVLAERTVDARDAAWVSLPYMQPRH